MKAASRSLLSTLVLLAVAGGAVAAGWFAIARKDAAKEAKRSAEERLYSFAPAKVKALTVEAKGETTALVRAGDGWRLESPVHADAERATVDALVDRIAELGRKSSVAPAPDAAALARYGLASPRAKVALTLDDGKKETLALGDENAFDGTAFVRTTGGAVELVPGDVKWSVERGAFDLREKRLLPFEEKDLQRVSIAAPRLSYDLVQEGGAWRLDAPSKERADEAAVSRVLGAIRGLRATAFLPVARDAKAQGLDRPRWTVKLASAAGARALAIGQGPAREKDRPGPLYARLDGAGEVAALAEGATKDLEQDLFALRDKSVLRFDRDAVAALKLTVGGSAFEARKEPAPGRMASVLWTLSSLRAKAFADETGRALAAHGLERPAREVALLGPDGKELDHLYVSAERSGKTYARSASSPRIVEIEGSALAGLPKSAQDMEEKAEAKPAARAKP